ncbi:MAG TPA: adenylate/guanylate cyclase domain-containing protein [Streptosporangiaceae bacterium]|nr:adenylate/guanylate cyclase domain-containing protein [Streptosporangiaceae bacterium]
MALSVGIPSGIVTLLFTDIEGSTRLWEAEPERMAVALRRHDDLVRAAIEEADGYVFKTVGDAFCAAFWTAQAAVAAALCAQRALAREDWITRRPLRVRMGLHTGTCEERGGDYFGPVVNRVARLEAVAHGGQIVLSGTTAELVSQSLGPGTALRDLGLHRLKDLGRPEHVFQLEAPQLEADFPPLASLDNPELPNNLPCLVNAFVGRERELSQVRTLVGSARLVTLTGAGGSGKTRLALQVAAELLDTTADGVWFIDLAPVTDSARIPAVVAAVLGLPDQCAPDLSDAVTDALGNQDALILLDNCEHLVGAAAKFCEQVIQRCPRVRILATSQELLGIDGERAYRVPSLSLPPADAESAADLGSSDAVRLFAERARLHDPGFSLDEQSAALVATLCRRLDGIPLALELAAARLSSMSLPQITERLDQRFRLLTGGSRNAMPRQQTLQATVDWSFGLLTQPERDMLTRLSVFAGGFDLEAAEAVCTSGSTSAADTLDVLDQLGSLVDKSLVIADRTPESVRYRLLETIRQYSAQELARTAGDGETQRVKDRHATYFLALAEAARPALTGSEQAVWLRRLDPEWDNLRAVFFHLDAADRVDDVLRLGVALERFAISRGHADVLTALRFAITKPGVVLNSLLVEALVVTSRLIGLFMRKDVGELAAGKRHAEQALALARELGDIRLEARALAQLAGASYFEHDLAAVRRLASLGAELASQIRDMQLLGELLAAFARTAPTPEDVRRIRLEVLACCRKSGDDLVAALELHHLYGLDLHAGLIENAAAYLTQSIRLAEQLGGDLFLYFMRADLGILLLIQDRPEEAVPVIRRCLLVARRIGVRIDASEVIFAAACCTAWQGHHARAAQLHGAADADIKTALAIGTINWSKAEQDLREQEQRQLRELMGSGPYEEAYQAGARLAPAQAVELALSRGPGA